MTSTGTAAKVVRKTPEGSIRIHTHGAITDKGSPFPARKPLPHAIRKRSAITTLSKASAARLRRFLAQAKGPEGWLCFGITLTVPGPPITVSEWRRLWSAYRSRIHRLKNFTLIWRIEMQERGQPHVHCVCWGKTGPGRLREHWLETLGILGPFEGPYDIDREITVTCSDGNYCEIKPGHAIVTHRGLWPGAEKHAFDTKGLNSGDNTGWWRYLAAHTSKSKQAQLGWKGRQWGIVNGQLLDRENPILIKLPPTALNKVIRCLRKVTGCRYASGHGQQTWFAKPDTCKRLSGWALASV